PLLTITDLAGVAKFAKSKGIMTMIDNTFASPINQNPIDFGIDVVCHSATKYMGGHSDICAGVVASSKEKMEKVYQTAICFGGSLSDYTVWLLERSLKTMGLRVKEQNANAAKMAAYLMENPDITHVHYPGLEDHPDHLLAKSQMKGFGGMLSFELSDEVDVSQFFKQLKLIKPSMSLAGLESTVSSPVTTSHALMSPEDRQKQGIKDSLVRFSLGIENIEDLTRDIEQAIKEVKSMQVHV
ncbi:MAG: PLP-dependent aspartate aminotransferase family protein, partial [Allomuricauda sp.]